MSVVTVALFREHFEEFKDPAQYRAVLIQRFLDIAQGPADGSAPGQLNPDRWGDNIDLGTELFVAHWITIFARNKRAVDAGGLPGAYTGPVSSKSAADVSVSYDTSMVKLENMGMFGLTEYGALFFQMAEYAGAGGIQLGVPNGMAGLAPFGRIF